MISPSDKALLARKGISEKQLQTQIDRYRKGFDALPLHAPATIASGILRLSDVALNQQIEVYRSAQKEVVKFVPASGAASRMFKQLFEYLNPNASRDAEVGALFFDGLDRFAFSEELKTTYEAHTGRSFQEAVEAKDPALIQYLLNEEGLNYGSLPKGLLSFHRYGKEKKTPTQEHVAEGIAYALKGGQLRLHFTVSPAHLDLFRQHVAEIRLQHPEVEMKIDFSTQHEATDTLSVDLNDALFRDASGDLLFRPSGHGALLQNLNQLDADIIYIKNIDNVVPDRLKEPTIQYKKAIAGVLLTYQARAFGLLEAADQGADIWAEAKALLEQMGTRGPLDKEEIRARLNRPIRVCGMVKNEGEPGGGPFWVKRGEIATLQIVESAQVSQEDPEQQALFASGTHFNPVDIVCGVRNYKGEKFDLMKYRDEETGFITEKSHEGKKLKTMELPGLWNGSMAHWNTLFVEVPLATFNPVKTVMDLLKDSHQ